MKTIYSNLLKEAQASPMLLSDLAGLETYISESYNNRSFIELLQNADDAGSTKFLVQEFGPYVLIANDGRKFNSSDIESLCRSASSQKVRGCAIGYRGIGFKSVVSIAQEIHIISGAYEITFSKELTKRLIPDAINVPLIRIPHPIKTNIKTVISSEINHLKSKGYTTFFIFSGVEIDQIKDEYVSFQQTSLLFLNHICELNIYLKNHSSAKISTLIENDSYKKICIEVLNNKYEWMLYSAKSCSIAFSVSDNEIVRLQKNEALIHAFLPTEDNCGLGILINADFSTDPSRRHLIFDKTTESAINNIVSLYTSLLENNLFNNNKMSNSIVNALLPYFDLRLVHLTKNIFEKTFANGLINTNTSKFSFIKLPPPWISIGDFVKIQIANQEPTISESCLNITGINALIKCFGAKTDNIFDILEKIENAQISINGYAQIAAFGIRHILMNQPLAMLLNAHIFLGKQNLYSLTELNEKAQKIDDSFIQLIIDNGITINDLTIFLKKVGLTTLLEVQSSDNWGRININEPSTNIDTPNLCCHFENNQISCLQESVNENEKTIHIKNIAEWYNSINNNREAKTVVSTIKRWRSAEENVLCILNSNGFDLRDVSTQNLGYDLEGMDPNGTSIYIEVKSLEYIGQKFRITNNEYAVAQYQKDKYYIALTIQTQDKIKIGMIKNPINSLKLNRQCVQWIWECSEYEYIPIEVNNS